MKTCPGKTQKQTGTRCPPHHKGNKAERKRGKQWIRGKHQARADGEQQQKRNNALQTGLHKGPHPFQVEHSPGNQIAGVNPIVKVVSKALHLLEKGEPKIAGDILRDHLTLIARNHGRRSAQR